MATVDDALKMFSGQTDAVNTLDTAVQKVIDGFGQLELAIDSAIQKMSELAGSFQSAPVAAQKAGLPAFLLGLLWTKTHTSCILI